FDLAVAPPRRALGSGQCPDEGTAAPSDTAGAAMPAVVAPSGQQASPVERHCLIKQREASLRSCLLFF
ncbi:MAG TPA: hypothetical protein VMD31_14760, partial [Opitutaceae bacterium]|nr:hypothetical protein [Opitutaceae bacterium]